MTLSFQGQNKVLRLQNYITRHKASLEKSGVFCYNAKHKVLVLTCLLALRCIWKCESARSPRPVKEFPLHGVRALCLVLMSLLQDARKMRWHLLSLLTTCLLSKKLPVRKWRSGHA